MLVVAASNNDEEYLQKIDYLDSLMQTHNVKKSIQRRVQKHYTYLKETGTGYAHKAIFPELPHSLRRDLVLSINQVRMQPIFRNFQFLEQFLSEIACGLRRTTSS